MQLHQALIEAARLAVKGEQLLVSASVGGCGPGVVHRRPGLHWAHFRAEGASNFLHDFAVDARVAAGAARKVKLEPSLVKTHGIPAYLDFGAGQHVPAVAVETGQHAGWREDAEWHEFSDAEWRSVFAVVQKVREDKIRPGLRRVRFAPWGVEAGDEAQFARLSATLPWKVPALVDGASLDKLGMLKGGVRVGFTDVFGYVEAGDVRRVVPRISGWFPPLDQVFPTALQGVPSVTVPVAPLLKFLRSATTQVLRRRLDVTVQKGILYFSYPRADAVHGFEVYDLSDLDGWQASYDGNRILESLRAWPAKTVDVSWLPTWGARSFLRLAADSYAEHVFPLCVSF